MYPILCVAVSRADDAAGLLHHLEDDAAVDVAHNVGVVWTHESACQEKGLFQCPEHGNVVQERFHDFHDFCFQCLYGSNLKLAASLWWQIESMKMTQTSNQSLKNIARI